MSAVRLAKSVTGCWTLQKLTDMVFIGILADFTSAQSFDKKDGTKGCFRELRFKIPHAASNGETRYDEMTGTIFGEYDSQALQDLCKSGEKLEFTVYFDVRETEQKKWWQKVRIAQIKKMI